MNEIKTNHVTNKELTERMMIHLFHICCYFPQNQMRSLVRHVLSQASNNLTKKMAQANDFDLLHAAEAGFLSRVKELVSYDKSLIKKCLHEDGKNRTFNFHGSPMHYACRSGHLSVVKYLLEQDPTIINQVDIENWTPLHYACYNGHQPIVRLLLQYNANVEQRDNYLMQKPIEFAMYRQFEDIVMLLDPNASWTRRSSRDIEQAGQTPVFRSKSKSNLFLARYRLDGDQIKQIEQFRANPQATPLQLKSVEDVELNNLSVDFILNHNFKEHMQQTLLLAKMDDQEDDYLRSSTTSTNEHLIVQRSRS